jgi:hypothetical protein
MPGVCARGREQAQRERGEARERSGPSELAVLVAAANNEPCIAWLPPKNGAQARSGKRPGAGWSAMAESTQAEVCGRDAAAREEGPC